MTDNEDRTFRLGDRVVRRVLDKGKTLQHGDVIGIAGNSFAASVGSEQVLLIGWADGTQTYEICIELRTAGQG